MYTISFAAVAYGGDLAVFLNRGIGLMLIGTAISAAIVGATASVRGMISHPEETPLLLVVSASPSLMAAATAAGAGPGTEEYFATFFVFLMCSTALTGLFMILVGRLRLSFVMRYLPYPIIGGVIVSIGYLLMIGSLSLILERTVDIYSLPAIFIGGGFAAVAPWAIGALGLFVAARWLPATAILPLGIFVAFVTFHIFLQIAGLSLAEAEAAGLLLGPFSEDGFLKGLSPKILVQAEWAVVLSHMNILIVLAPITALSCLIHIQAICRITGEVPDLDRELVSNGIANVAGAGSGNLLTYPAISTSLLGAQFGTGTLLACGGTVGLSLAVAIFGADLLGVLPRGLLAMMILYLGLDMLVSTLATEWRRLPSRDFVPILAILTATITFGLIYGLILGIAVSIFLFVLYSARVPFIRLDTTLEHRRSMVERGASQAANLEEAGHRVRILEISGYLFFGTGCALGDRVSDLMAEGSHAEDVLVLDFRLVPDIDASALSSLESIAETCRLRGVKVYFTGLTDFVAQRLNHFGLASEAKEMAAINFKSTLDDALQEIEEDILAHFRGEGRLDSDDTFLRELAEAMPGFDLADKFDTVSLKDGATLFEEAAPSTEIYVLLKGRATAIVGAHTEAPFVIANFEPGAVIGEMAFYQDALRSATVIAQGTAELVRINAKTLSEGGHLPDKLLAAFHRIAARHLSKRLDRATKLLRDASL